MVWGVFQMNNITLNFIRMVNKCHYKVVPSTRAAPSARVAPCTRMAPPTRAVPSTRAAASTSALCKSRAFYKSGAFYKCCSLQEWCLLMYEGYEKRSFHTPLSTRPQVITPFTVSRSWCQLHSKSTRLGFRDILGGGVEPWTITANVLVTCTGRGQTERCYMLLRLLLTTWLRLSKPL